MYDGGIDTSIYHRLAKKSIVCWIVGKSRTLTDTGRGTSARNVFTIRLARSGFFNSADPTSPEREIFLGNPMLISIAATSW